VPLANAGLTHIPPEALLVLAALLLLWKRAHWVLFRLTAWCCDWGAFRTTRALAGFLEMLPLADWMRSPLWRLELYALSALGETEAAVAGARRLASHASADGCAPCANCAINLFINAGLYREALAIERDWQGPSHPEESRAAREWTLARFNLVEAVYNLGGWEAARARLAALEEPARADPFLWNFFPIQRAWILAHTGHGEEALRALEQVDWRRISRVYRSEFFFTRAAALLALHRYDEAQRAAVEGLERARRDSSTRNGLFLLGRIALAAERLDEALRFFEAGASHPTYKGQGGDALLAWGDCLEKLGRHDEARVAWGLVLERDKQSGAAWEATSRLGSTTPGTVPRTPGRTG
jgi:tetratricopeptide (TPR) repeat protein